MEIGTTITLKELNNSKKATYKAKIIDYDENCLYIDYPVHQLTSKTVFLRIGTKLEASYIGNDQAIYHFSTEVLKKVSLNIPALCITPPGEHVRRIQRRRYVRVKTSIDLAIHPPCQSFDPFLTTSLDISGGGLSFILPRDVQIEEGQTINIWLALPMSKEEFEYLSIDAKVLRVKSSDHDLHIASVKFTNTSNKIEQKIVRFIFQVQREYRRKGLL